MLMFSSLYNCDLNVDRDVLVRVSLILHNVDSPDLPVKFFSLSHPQDEPPRDGWRPQMSNCNRELPEHR